MARAEAGRRGCTGGLGRRWSLTGDPAWLSQAASCSPPSIPHSDTPLPVFERKQPDFPAHPQAPVTAYLEPHLPLLCPACAQKGPGIRWGLLPGRCDGNQQGETRHRRVDAGASGSNWVQLSASHQSYCLLMTSVGRAGDLIPLPRGSRPAGDWSGSGSSLSDSAQCLVRQIWRGCQGSAGEMCLGRHSSWKAVSSPIDLAVNRRVCI